MSSQLIVVTNTAGNDPAQSSTAWLDRFFGMGEFTKDLNPQYDCPPESVYLPATTFSILGNIQRRRVTCIFEQDVGKPLSRPMFRQFKILIRLESEKFVLDIDAMTY